MHMACHLTGVVPASLGNSVSWLTFQEGHFHGVKLLFGERLTELAA
jgi:hypothetical protein